MTQRQKDIAFMWAVCIAAIAMILVTFMIVRANDRQITIEIVNTEQANTDIRGYYNAYSGVKTQGGRDLIIKHIKEQFKGFDAVQITDLKYRNFLINTRGS